MNLGFVFRPSNPYLNGQRAQLNMRKFFFDALPQVADVTFYGDDQELDLGPHVDKHDAWVFFDAVAWGLPDRLLGVDKIKAPKVCMIGDCHGAEKVCPTYGVTKREACEHFGFDAYFFQHTEGYFRRFFPVDWTYWWLPFGVDETLYADVRPWAERRSDKVLLTGVLGPEFYPLRTQLAGDPRIHYHPPGSYSGPHYKPGQFDGDRYKLLLEEFRAHVSSGYSVLCKHFESPAAGCLTFAHCGTDDLLKLSGMVDGEHVMATTKASTSNLIQWFLETPHDPKWEKIAENGRRYVLENFTHRKMAQRLVELIETLL